MSLKNILVTLVVVIAVVAVAYFAFGKFLGGDSSIAPTALAVTPSKILPLGTRLDFGLIKKYNPDGKLFNYPKVDTNEVGPALSDLIKPVQ